jgi:pimeloyl-ACP methyl ester carboxylesterase
MAMWVVRMFVLASLVAVIGCGGSDDAEQAQQTTSTTTASAVCGEGAVEPVTLTTDDGVELAAVLVGEGDVGVVLGHQLRSDYCSWVPFAKELARRHVSALAINFASVSPDDDMVAGARELQRRGAERIMLAGASMGGTAALVAAARVDAAGVASLSGPREFGGLDALSYVRRLDVPALFLAAQDDAGFVDDARTLYRATKSRDKALVITTGFEHGTDLLGDPKARRALLDFLVSG